MEKKHNKFKADIASLRSIIIVFSITIILLMALATVVLMNPDLISDRPSEIEIAGPAIDTDPDGEDEWNKIENGIHVRTGLKDAEGLMAVVNNCTNCHSADLVMQNRMNRERWIETIRWMQETQNLWNLGENEDIILDYLVTNYPVIDMGRRAPLTDIEWYSLSE